MSTRKRTTQVSKPTLGTQAAAALEFAKGDQKAAQTASREKPVHTHRKARGKAPAPAKSLSGQVPDGDVRLTANIRADLHVRLKIAAATERTTVGELIERWIEADL
jgi:hypothetical protein